MACEIFEKDIATILNGVLVGRMPENDGNISAVLAEI